MLGYLCERCHYSSIYKKDLIRHYERKNKCNRKYSRKSVQDCMEELNTLKKKDIMNISEKEFIKEKFNIGSKRMDKKSEEDSINYNTVDNSSHTESYMNGSHNMDNSNNMDNSYNGVINSHNIDNSKRIVIVNSFANTDFSKIKDNLKEMDFLKDDDADVIVKYLESVHFNKDIPENQNVYAENMSRPRIMVHDGKRFKGRGLGKTGIELFLSDVQELIEKNLSDSELYATSERLLDEYYSTKDEDRKIFIRNKIFLTLHNNKDMIKDNIKSKRE